MADNVKAMQLRISAVRKDSGLNQKIFAREIGCSASYLSEVESGKGKPSVEMLVGIAIRYHDVSLRWLLTGDGEMRELPGPPARTQGGHVDRISECAAGYTADGPLRRLFARIGAWWARAEPDQRVWFAVQLLREFPELSNRGESDDGDAKG